MTNPVDEIMNTLASRGGEIYGGEQVTQLQHALQCATLAVEAQADDSLVVAALLHDYGHLLGEDDAAAASRGIDLVHEEIGANHLDRWFTKAVTQPIRFHVPAKRYLCAVDPAYFAGLSPVSVRSLEVQGGPFSEPEADKFITQPHAGAAVQLRIWDDRAKDPDVEPLPLEAFRERLEKAAMVYG